MKKSKKKIDGDTLRNEQNARAYAERIAELKASNADLAIALEDYRRREKAIAEALSYAEELRKNAEKEIKLRYSLERERLTAFRKKWLAAVRDGTAKESFAQTEALLEECYNRLSYEFNDAEPPEADDIPESLELDTPEEEPDVTDKKRHIDELSESELEELLKQLDSV